MTKLNKKIEQLMELITGSANGKKHSQEEASVSETSPTARICIDSEAIRYIAKAKELSILLPDTFNSNPKHLRKFLSELNFCFLLAPSKYAGNEPKVIAGGRFCSHKKEYR